MNSAYGKYVTKIALAWTGCFVLFFFLYMLILAPQKEARTRLEKQLEEKKRIHSLALEAAKKETKIKLNEQLENLRRKLNDLVIDFEDSTNLTFDISRIANDKNVSSFSIETENKHSGKNNKKSEYKQIFECYFDISFDATSFNQFATLLNTLERHRPVIFINKFTITRSDRGNSENRVKMSLAAFIRNKQQISIARL